MKRSLVIAILVGGFMAMLAFPPASLAGKGYGRMKKDTTTEEQSGVRQQRRLRDGSCGKASTGKAGAMKRQGKTYGPGDGTGNRGMRPQDGIGNGAGQIN
jgi:hypothetical protein